MDASLQPRQETAYFKAKPTIKDGGLEGDGDFT